MCITIETPGERPSDDGCWKNATPRIIDPNMRFDLTGSDRRVTDQKLRRAFTEIAQNANDVLDRHGLPVSHAEGDWMFACARKLGEIIE